MERFKLILEMLDNPANKEKIIAQGVTNDDPSGINMTGHGHPLRWIAKIGSAKDWCIYCHWYYHTAEWIAKYGDKVIMKENIANVIDCDAEVMKRYNY